MLLQECWENKGGGCSATEVSELEYQARWLAGEFGYQWITENGKIVRIIDFGRWNREPGPDFTQACLQFDQGVPQRGDIELDRNVRDWERHGHATNPTFQHTLLHLYFTQPTQRCFTRTYHHHEVEQVCLLNSNPERLFSDFHTSDGYSDPSLICSPLLSPLSPLREEWKLQVSSAQLSAILQNAARYRMEKKSRQLQQWISSGGPEEAYFQATARVLGYKHNSLPFWILAQRLGWQLAGGPEGEALLFGLAGFLEGLENLTLASDLHTLLEHWQRQRERLQRWILPESLWCWSGMRPANHPHRRLAALSVMAQNWKALCEHLEAPQPDGLKRFFASLGHDFWHRHTHLSARMLKRSQALVGQQRCIDFLINVYYPLAMHRSPMSWKAFLQEKGWSGSYWERAIVRRFFQDPLPPPVFFALAVHQQGLLQLEEDWNRSIDPHTFCAHLLSMRSASGAS